MDHRYFHGVRTLAASALAGCATQQVDWIGLFHLQKSFSQLFCFENSPMTRSNDFSDQRLYRLQCTIPKAMAGIRDSAGKAPQEVKRFFLDKLKFNDNSNNQVCSILHHARRVLTEQSTLILTTLLSSLPGLLRHWLNRNRQSTPTSRLERIWPKKQRL